jgi:hypothetical protein
MATRSNWLKSIVKAGMSKEMAGVLGAASEMTNVAWSLALSQQHFAIVIESPTVGVNPPRSVALLT